MSKDASRIKKSKRETLHPVWPPRSDVPLSVCYRARPQGKMKRERKLLMTTAELDIAGRVYTDETSLQRFSRDASSYNIKPQLVVEPANEEDVLAVVEYSRRTGKSITCRSGGSGLSGAGVGSGILLNFKSLMNSIKRLGKELVVEPGVVLDDFLQNIHGLGLMLPAVPSSSAWCALGGNIGTRLFPP